MREEALTETASWKKPEKTLSHLRGLAYLGVCGALGARHRPRDGAQPGDPRQVWPGGRWAASGGAGPRHLLDLEALIKTPRLILEQGPQQLKA